MTDEEERALGREAQGGDRAAKDRQADGQGTWWYREADGLYVAMDDAALDRAEALGMRPTTELLTGDLVVVRPRIPSVRAGSPEAGAWLGVITSTERSMGTFVATILDGERTMAGTTADPQQVFRQSFHGSLAVSHVIVVRRGGLPPRRRK